MRRHSWLICRLLSLPLIFAASGLAKAEEKDKADVSYNHLFEIRNIEGWTVYIENRLLEVLEEKKLVPEGYAALCAALNATQAKQQMEKFTAEGKEDLCKLVNPWDEKNPTKPTISPTSESSRVDSPSPKFPKPSKWPRNRASSI